MDEDCCHRKNSPDRLLCTNKTRFHSFHFSFNELSFPALNLQQHIFNTNYCKFFNASIMYNTSILLFSDCQEIHIILSCTNKVKKALNHSAPCGIPYYNIVKITKSVKYIEMPS